MAASLIPTERFSLHSHRMLALRDTILQAWEVQVRETLPRSRQLGRPLLIDTMPVLYERMCAVLTPAYFERDGIDVTILGAEHGIERATLTDFGAETVVAEFQVFRSVLFDVLDADDLALTGPERRALHLTIDMAVRESVRAFVGAAGSLRERFTGAVVHDLRQPMSNMNMAAQLILQLGPPPGIAQWAALILRNGERMAGMLDDMQDALAIRPAEHLRLNPQQCELLALAQSVAQRARDYQGAAVQVDGEPVTGWWDRQALERALENLIATAQQHGEPGATIEVRVALDKERAVLSVRSQGRPPAPAELDAMFASSGRAPGEGGAPAGGSSPGLPYVRSVAQSLGGTVAAFADADTGTVFVIDIPVDARPWGTRD